MMPYDGYRAQVEMTVDEYDAFYAQRWHHGRPRLDGLNVIHHEFDIPRDVMVMTLDGERLPGWMRGTLPMSFRSLAELKQYRTLRRIYDIRWPNDVAKSMGTVNLILLNRGSAKVIRSTKLRNPWDPPVFAHVVTMDEYRDMYGLATIEIGKEFS
jgi:hypothetical protein